MHFWNSNNFPEPPFETERKYCSLVKMPWQHQLGKCLAWNSCSPNPRKGSCKHWMPKLTLLFPPFGWRGVSLYFLSSSETDRTVKQCWTQDNFSSTWVEFLLPKEQCMDNFCNIEFWLSALRQKVRDNSIAQFLVLPCWSVLFPVGRAVHFLSSCITSLDSISSRNGEMYHSLYRGIKWTQRDTPVLTDVILHPTHQKHLRTRPWGATLHWKSFLYKLPLHPGYLSVVGQVSHPNDNLQGPTYIRFPPHNLFPSGPGDSKGRIQKEQQRHFHKKIPQKHLHVESTWVEIIQYLLWKRACTRGIAVLISACRNPRHSYTRANGLSSLVGAVGGISLLFHPFLSSSGLLSLEKQEVSVPLSKSYKATLNYR